MIYLLLAILCSATISVLMRLSAEKVSGNMSMLAMNYLMCLLIGGAYTGWGNLLPEMPGIRGALVMGGIQGVLYMAGFVLLQLNIRKNGVVLSSIFQKLGLLVTMAGSVFLFGEVPESTQLVGFVIALVAVVLINLEKDSAVLQSKGWLLVILVAGGLADLMAKVYEELGSPDLSAQFLFYTFAVALVLCLVLMVKNRERPGKAEVLYGFAVGVPNYFVAKFLLASLNSLPAVIVYPTFSVATILTVTCAGVLVFHEKLSRRQVVAVGMILVALVLLNI